MKFLLCALEPSADALGASLMRSLRERTPAIGFIGCGGPLMAKEGLETLFPIDRFSVIGPTAALKALPAALTAADALARLGATEKPAAAVFIDSWSFSRIAAQKMKRATPGVRLYKYVAPQVWASRPKRAEIAARLFDGVLCLFEFEPVLFEKAGARAVWVGHSGFHSALARPDRAEAFRKSHDLGAAPLLAVLPGSRSAELRRHEAPFGDAMTRVLAVKPETRFVVPAAPGLEPRLQELVQKWPGCPVVVPGAERYDAFQAADAALAASGTVIGELAIFKTPMVVAYRTDLLTAAWARRVLTTNHVSLVNITAGREVAPEFLQERCRGELMAPALLNLLKGGPERAAQLEAFPAIVRKITGKEAPAGAAAEALLNWVATGKDEAPIESASNGA